ncbi:hypothetical protein [Vibrio rumoiensis]|uniref:Checkpoint protein n=1 Tax=Vibrio rumoiensis TaxID=76258 RepID=A0ABW7IS10_9VIBR
MMAKSWVILDKNGRHKFIKFIANVLVDKKDEDHSHLLLTIKPNKSELHISNHIACLSGMHASYIWPIIDSTMTTDMNIEVPAKRFYSLIDKLMLFGGHIQMIQIKTDTFQFKSVYEPGSEQGDLFRERSSAAFIPVNEITYSLTVPSSKDGISNEYLYDIKRPIHSVSIKSSILLEYLKSIKVISKLSHSGINEDFTSFVFGLDGNDSSTDKNKVMKLLSLKGESFVSYEMEVESSIGQVERCHLNDFHLNHLIGLLTQVKNIITLDLHEDRLVVRRLGWSCSFKVLSITQRNLESEDRRCRLFDLFVKVDEPKALLESLIRLDITESNEQNALSLQYSHQAPTQVHLAIDKGTTKASDVLITPTPWFDDDVSILINAPVLNEMLRFLSDGVRIGFDKKARAIHLKGRDDRHYLILQSQKPRKVDKFLPLVGQLKMG